MFRGPATFAIVRLVNYFQEINFFSRNLLFFSLNFEEFYAILRFLILDKGATVQGQHFHFPAESPVKGHSDYLVIDREKK